MVQFTLLFDLLLRMGVNYINSFFQLYMQRCFIPVQVIWVTVGEAGSDILCHFLVRENVPQAICGHHQHVISAMLILGQVIYSHLHKQAVQSFYVTAVDYITFFQLYREGCRAQAKVSICSMHQQLTT